MVVEYDEVVELIVVDVDIVDVIVVEFAVLAGGLKLFVELLW